LRGLLSSLQSDIFIEGEKMKEELKLVPLRIPAGWTVQQNKFTEVNSKEFISEDYRYVWEFDEDILLLSYSDPNYSLDLGWYPSFNPEGAYCLRLIKDCDWENPVEIFSSRVIDEIKTMIETYLEKYKYLNYYQEEKK
jgi:hypothetical protein